MNEDYVHALSGPETAVTAAEEGRLWCQSKLSLQFSYCSVSALLPSSGTVVFLEQATICLQYAQSSTENL